MTSIDLRSYAAFVISSGLFFRSNLAKKPIHQNQASSLAIRLLYTYLLRIVMDRV